MSADLRIVAFGIAPLPPGTIDAGEPPDERQVEICREWIREFVEPTTRINSRSSYRGGVGCSYHLKHVVESWTAKKSQSGLAYDYIANGAFIEAAKREGYRFVRDGERSPNAYFNMRFRKGARQ